MQWLIVTRFVEQGHAVDQGRCDGERFPQEPGWRPGARNRRFHVPA